MALAAAKRRRDARDLLDDRHRLLIERVESLTQSQSGADRTWIEATLRATRRHDARARRVR
jgi:hypothetical protein